ncbi:MAG: peptidoglycan-associated lipoprotein Pal [Desulfobacterota bacterium]|nr:peptidoglycan-associated lipoprotein Pal [Thermodesulfobacteriota bacterium]
MKPKPYAIPTLFVLFLGLLLFGCPKKTVMKDEPSVAQREAAKVEAERAAKEREAKEAKERELKEKERREMEAAKAKEREEQARREFEKSLVPRKTPGIEGVVFESSMLKMIHFDFDKYDIRPQDAEILKQNAEVLKRFPSVKIQIEGHCDERGTEEYNLALGERRANSTKKYLISLGIAADRMTTISYGEERPLDPGHNEEAWSKNRRAQFVIIAK